MVRAKSCSLGPGDRAIREAGRRAYQALVLPTARQLTAVVAAVRPHDPDNLHYLKHLCLDVLDVFHHQGALPDSVYQAYDGDAGRTQERLGVERLLAALHPEAAAVRVHSWRYQRTVHRLATLTATRHSPVPPTAGRLATLLALIADGGQLPLGRYPAAVFTVPRLCATHAPVPWLVDADPQGAADHAALLRLLDTHTDRPCRTIASKLHAVVRRGPDHAQQLLRHTRDPAAAVVVAHHRTTAALTILYAALIAAEADRLVGTPGGTHYADVTDVLSRFIHDLCDWKLSHGPTRLYSE